MTTKNAATSAKWMTCPNIQCEHPGLAYIYALDQLIITPKPDPLHEVIGVKGTKYTIFNKDKEKTFVATQKTSFKNYSLKVFNYYGNEVICVKRNVFVNKISIWAPGGNLVGTMAQECLFKNSYTIKNADGKVFLTIEPKKNCPLLFKIVSKDEEVGEIRKGVDDENLDNFGVTFPMALDIQVKAVLIGACFLIAYLKY